MSIHFGTDNPSNDLGVDNDAYFQSFADGIVVAVYGKENGAWIRRVDLTGRYIRDYLGVLDTPPEGIILPAVVDGNYNPIGQIVELSRVDGPPLEVAYTEDDYTSSSATWITVNSFPVDTSQILFTALRLTRSGGDNHVSMLIVKRFPL